MKHAIGNILCAAALLALAGCVSADDLRAADEARCDGYGFQRSTPDFASCLQRESLARRYELYSTPVTPWWGAGAFIGPRPYW
jgi:hypothetical protein